jgi:hypothetical protein
MVPRLPSLQIIDTAGISLPMNGPAQISSEDCSRFRQRQLSLENINRVPLFNLSFRMQLPETIVAVRQTEIPPGLDLHFRPELIQMMASAQGEGASVTMLGPQRPTTNWTLKLNHLPGGARTQIDVLTAVDWIRDHEPPNATSGNPDVLQYYIEGHFFFDYRGEHTRMHIVVPIEFDPVSRALKSLPPQPDFAPYKSISRI